ncbi:MAG: cbb3-type cytochrome c oxidase subunit I [Betaproteobacteria bacterium]|nr:cbb3-type cytochrome c oxidase subunit I [Betaproteobacteria bacterium]
MKTAQHDFAAAQLPRGTAWAAVSPATAYDLAVPLGARRRLAVGWLTLGLVSLIGAGVFSVLLVLARTPYVQHLFPVADFFRVALVVHVDLSILVWFLALAGVLWSINSTERLVSLGYAALILAAAGTAIIGVAPFLGRGAPVMSNYVPVLDDALFLGGLVVFAEGVLLLTLRSLAAVPRVGVRPDGAAALRFGLNAAAVSTAVALLAFVWSYLAIPAGLPGKAYYELLFWGGGHVIQFTYTLLMLVAWLWLASACGGRVPLTPRVTLLMFGVALAAAFATPVIYLAYDVTSGEHRRLFTWLMQFGGGLAILPVALAVAAAMLRGGAVPQAGRPLRAALISSIVLFGVGGLIGFMIQGANVKIPAHYHGSIVGVTLALMGVTYLLLPRLGFGAPAPRLATLQPYLYGAGQLLHVLGLVWSGGYGVQRKVAGAAQVLSRAEEVAAMGLMGLGGLVAVAGGLLFVLIVLHAIWRRPRTG